MRAPWPSWLTNFYARLAAAILRPGAHFFRTSNHNSFIAKRGNIIVCGFPDSFALCCPVATAAVNFSLCSLSFGCAPQYISNMFPNNNRTTVQHFFTTSSDDRPQKFNGSLRFDFLRSWKKWYNLFSWRSFVVCPFPRSLCLPLGSKSNLAVGVWIVFYVMLKNGRKFKEKVYFSKWFWILIRHQTGKLNENWDFLKLRDYW